MSNVLDQIAAEGIKKDLVPFAVGDGVKVSIKIKEGDKERVQVFAGTVIARDGHGANETFTVRAARSASASGASTSAGLSSTVNSAPSANAGSAAASARRPSGPRLDGVPPPR